MKVDERDVDLMKEYFEKYGGSLKVISCLIDRKLKKNKKRLSDRSEKQRRRKAKMGSRFQKGFKKRSS